MYRLSVLAGIAALAGAAALISAEWPFGSPTARPSDCAAEPSRAQAHLDLRRSRGRETRLVREFDYPAMYAATGIDAIPSIDRPCHERPEEATALPDSSLVIGVDHGGEARAYPVDLLSLHEVVNDVVGGVPIAVTWCPLCASAVGYDRRIGNQTLTFGVSGYLYRANLMLFDRETGSLWSQLLGGAVTGRMRGTALRRIPIVHETWARWRRRHPETLVLSILRDRLGRSLAATYAYSSVGNEDSNVPYSTYASKVPIYNPGVVRGVADASRVYGLVLAGRAKAYPVPALWRAGVANDAFGGIPILAVYNGASVGVDLYSRRIGNRVLRFTQAGKLLADVETDSRWSPATGRAVAGPLRDRTLARLPAVSSYWFAWRDFYPRTAVWSAPRVRAPRR
jgi:Protein of unknown function (DUF3179)